MKHHLARLRRSTSFWGFISLGVRSFSTIATIPLVVANVPTDELAFWYIFSSFLAFVTVLDLGLTTTIGRTLASNDGFHRGLTQGYFPADTFQLLSIMRQVYLALGLFSFVFLSSLGGAWIWIRSSGHIEQEVIRMAWLVFCPVFALSIAANFGRGLLFAINRLDIFNLLTAVGAAIQLLIMVVGLLNNYSLMALVAANVCLFLCFASGAVFAFQKAPALRSLVRAKEIFQWQIARPLLTTSIGTFSNTLSNFLVLNVNTLIASKFLSLSETASYGLTLQCSFLACQASSIWIEAKHPVIARLHAESPANLGRLVVSRMRMFLLSYAACAAVLISTGNTMLSWFGSHTALLPTYQLLAICVFHCLFSHQVHFEMIGLCLGKNPFIRAYTVTAVITLVAVLLTVPFLKIWALLLIPMGAQLVYNSWNVVRTVLSMIGLSLRQYGRGLIGFPPIYPSPTN